MQKDGLKAIFRRLRCLLKQYEGVLVPKVDQGNKYDLWSFKDIEIAGRKRTEVYFAGLVIQSNYVGLYYMPVYVDTSLAKVFSPELLKIKKGKSCFHIRELTPQLEKDIKKALKIGYELYEKRGWVDTPKCLTAITGVV